MKSGSQQESDSGDGDSRRTNPPPPCADAGTGVASAINIGCAHEGLPIYPSGATNMYTPTSPLSLSQPSSMRSFMKLPVGQPSSMPNSRALPAPPQPPAARCNMKRKDSFVGTPLRLQDTCRATSTGGQLDFLTHLPYEIAMVVVIYADFPAITTISEVSRSWSRFARDNAVWRRLFLQQREWRTARALATAYYHTARPERAFARATDSPMLSSLGGGAGASGACTPCVGVGEQSAGGDIAALLTSRILSAYSGSSLRPAIALQHMVAPSPTLSAGGGFDGRSQQRPRGAVGWRHLFQQRLALDRNWSSGTADVHVLTGHADSVYCVQYDHDKIVTGSRDRTIRVWDSTTLQCVRTLTGHDASVLCLKYDNATLVTGSSDATVIVWNWGAGTPALRLVSHAAGVLDVAFNDEYIVSCSKDCTIKVWRRDDGRLLRTMAGHRGPVNAVQLCGTRIVSASGDSLIKMWDIKTGDLIRTFSGHTRGLACVQFDGRTIVSGSSDQLIKVWDAETGVCKQTLRGHKDLVRTLHYAGGHRAVSGSYDQTVKVWDITTGKCTLDLKDMHTSWVFDVQFSASRIVSTSQDQKIIIWDFAKDLDVADIN
ncbi:hypothetical protein H4R21_001718 [Coemansia helicoidea]|uniref:Uncharacterized protein n=1 Tax=Coemansia helicoidea TaxID=1286919 RepID=A0ACC1LB91_9FUNG|nr:hypothetical protein H4R21_001718 [Coemansia helicoidea]